MHLARIDCPESNQDYGEEATATTKGLALNQDARLTAIEIDCYAHMVAEVRFLDGRSLNYELVKAGTCWWSRKFAPNDTELKQLEKEARKQRRGVWATSNPNSPWEWRRKTSEATFGQVTFTEGGTPQFMATASH